MKIIGIHIEKVTPFVTKNLNAGDNGWYPFGNYQYPKYMNDHWYWQKDGTQHEDDVFVDRLYKSSLNESSITRSNFARLRISVCCIVGQNGSGKTTLLEILLRIINNFSARIFEAIGSGMYSVMQDGRSLCYAGGLYASMVFEDYGKLYAIQCSDQSVYYMEYLQDGDIQIKEVKTELESRGYWMQLLSSKFFYTIYTNYSIYSFNEADYSGELETETVTKSLSTTGGWIRGLLDKNDGYNAPIVILPYRGEGGVIDPQKEEQLATSRLSTLALLYKAHKIDFFGGYECDSIEYSFNEESRSLYDQRWKTLAYSKLPINFQQNDCAKWLSVLTEIWDQKLSDCKLFVKERNQDVKDALISYLCYKTLKICVTYSDYGRWLGLKKIPKEIGKNLPEDILKNALYTNNKQINFNELVEAFLNPNNKSHITLKIRQCINFAQNGFYKRENKLTISKYLKSVKLWPNQNLPDIVGYDDVHLRMPPPIYKYKIWCHRKGGTDSKNLTFCNMSSGERHLMCAFSYILYHVNNVLSVKSNPERVAYKHINIVLDEVELYYHPEYQRVLIHRLMDMFSVCQLNTDQLESINLIFVTHSPFVLSDIPASRILYLRDGHVELSGCGKTLGANINDLLANKFFLNHGFMGELARKNLDNCLSWMEKNDVKNADDVDYNKRLIEEIGDPILYNYFLSLYKDSIHR